MTTRIKLKDLPVKEQLKIDINLSHLAAFQKELEATDLAINHITEGGTKSPFFGDEYNKDDKKLQVVSSLAKLEAQMDLLKTFIKIKEPEYQQLKEIAKYDYYRDEEE